MELLRGGRIPAMQFQCSAIDFVIRGKNAVIVSNRGSHHFPRPALFTCAQEVRG
jgi:hypothetical protein